MARELKRYRVWDPTTPDEISVFFALTPEDAAAHYAEDDAEGRANGLYYSDSDFTLRVSDPDDDVWEVRATLEWHPHFSAARVRG